MAPLLVESVTLRYDTMGNSPRWVKTSDFTKRGTYGVITEIHGEGSATVHTKDGDMKRAIGQLCPLAGNCLSR